MGKRNDSDMCEGGNSNPHGCYPTSTSIGRASDNQAFLPGLFLTGWAQCGKKGVYVGYNNQPKPDAYRVTHAVSIARAGALAHPTLDATRRQA